MAVNYNLTDVRKLVTPGSRGGIVARFDVTKVQGFVGYVFIREKGQSSPLNMGTWCFLYPISLRSRQWWGRVANFMWRISSQGTFPFVSMEQKICKFEMMVPGSEDVMVELGKSTCEMH